MEKGQLDKFLENFQTDRESSIDKEAGNPLENPHFVTLIESALKGLEYVGYATMDWKLLSIIELTKAYIKEKKEELNQSQKGNNSRGLDIDWSGTYY